MVVEMRESKTKPVALTDWAYDAIKDSILNLRARPGSLLHIEKLAEELGISRTPVREALLRLQTEGLVRVQPRVGFFVVEMTPADLAGLLEVREWLESHATAKAASMLTDADLGYLDELMESTAKAIEQGDRKRYLEIEELFHGLFVERCGNKHLLSLMKSLDNMTRRERVLSVSSADNIRHSLAEHRRVVAALHERSPEKAGALMAAHISAVRERVCAIVAGAVSLEKGT
jgi:DNA-binding GntR family transcriptional regulator